MPANPRVRNNNVQGTITDNPLSSTATTINSAGLANLEVISSEHAVLTLDPLRASGAPEYVIVTAHTGSATSATVTRGAYGSTARSHASGTAWVHAPLTEDFLQIVAATSDITDPYEGQLVYEHDTDIYHGRTASAWVEVVGLGAWQTWSPTLTNLTLGNGTVTARFTRAGRTVHYRFRFVLGSTSAVGSVPEFTLPVAPNVAAGDLCGDARLRDSGTADHRGLVVFNSGSTVTIKVNRADATHVTEADVTATVPHTWATNDSIIVEGTYEATS